MRSKVPAWLIVIGLLFIIACENKRRLSAPTDVIPNIKQVLDALRVAKASSEDAAARIRRFLPRRLATGEHLYADARNAYSRAIDGMRDSLMMTKGTVPIEQVNALLRDADEQRDKFHNWCYGEARAASGSGIGSAQSFVDVVISLASLLNDFQKIQDSRDQEQRTYFVNELEKCKWASWNDLRGR